ncbi:hypothetical protein CCHL11_04734 [Colletotrichum chlorophyti]|uniref:Uncharacterized protein n=1 Tax=Colletotrichum chlorophyti TaxID=708187 RepID=A0A1Q8S1K5_9PEZI|nr:hypothetical protein CCHL11_04734 [Colletotrichum chlorophyti]
MSILSDKVRDLPDASSPPTYSTAATELPPSPSSLSLPPTYDAATSGTSTSSGEGTSPMTPPAFTPTASFQIETSGKQWLSLPVATRPDPIPVYRVEAGSWAADSVPAFVSMRFSRGDGSCHLVRGDDGSQMPACTTVYRFGPGKPPLFRLPRPTAPPASSSTAAAADDTLELKMVSASLTSRTQVLETPHGTFRWRYGSRKERAAVPGADDLLLCELVRVASPAGGETREESTVAAQLVRGEGTRTKGSGKSTAGNGGRLMVDLREWMGSKGDAAGEVEVLLIAGCICMLKKEVDRRRLQQMMLIAAGASGGA